MSNLSKKLGNSIKNDIRQNGILYLICIVCLAIGITTGSFSIKALDEGQKKDLLQYFNSFLETFKTQNLDNQHIFKVSLQNNLILFFTFWISGATVFGIPVIIILLLFKGFLIGYTVGFLIDALSMKGIALSSIAIFPQNVFIIPGFLMLSVNGILFSARTIKNRKIYLNRYWDGFMQYTITSLLICGLIVIGSLIEAYMVPMLIVYAI